MVSEVRPHGHLVNNHYAMCACAKELLTLVCHCVARRGSHSVAMGNFSCITMSDEEFSDEPRRSGRRKAPARSSYGDKAAVEPAGEMSAEEGEREGDMLHQAWDWLQVTPRLSQLCAKGVRAGRTPTTTPCSAQSFVAPTPFL